MERRRCADFILSSAHLNYEGVAFHPSAFPVLWGPISRIVTSEETAILRERRRLADFGPIFAQRNYTGSHFPILRDRRTVGKLIPRIATPDESHFGQNGHPEGAPTVGGVSPRFHPPR